MSAACRCFCRFRAVALLLLIACLFVALNGCGITRSAPHGKSGEELAPARASQVAATVRKQIGARYRYGGSTPRGFDCSGLIWWGYKQHGVNVPRLAADQAGAGRGVPVAAARAGDILVFKTPAGLHTGLYAGNGAFIHAPSSGKRVREESLKSAYWRPRLMAVRRVYI
jgi:cell wall-associated NlpC family hydrolase